METFPLSPLSTQLLHLRAEPSVTATFGEVVVTPVPYHSFRVGPFSCTLPVQDGEDPLVVIQRAQDVVNKHATSVYQKAKAFWFREWKVGE